MAKKKKSHKRKATQSAAYVEIPVDYGMDEDYIQYGPQYDTVNDCPVIPGETMTVEKVTFRRLTTGTRSLLRSTMSELVTAYWQEKKLIPVDADLKKLRQQAILAVYGTTGQYAKDGDEAKHMLNECVGRAINGELKKENANNDNSRNVDI